MYLPLLTCVISAAPGRRSTRSVDEDVVVSGGDPRKDNSEGDTRERMAQGCNSIDIKRLGHEIGHETGPHSGPNSVLGHYKLRHVSKLQT